MSEQSCETRDLARGGSALLLWCLPFIALIVGLNWQKARPMLWIPAFLVMAAACIGQRCAMRQTALLRDGTCLFARGPIRRAFRIESGADASRRISVCCFGHYRGRLPG